MMKELSALKDSFSAIAKKVLLHHPAIAILLALIAMIYVAYSVSVLITLPSDEAYRAEQQATKVKTRFDEETVQKIERLSARQENSPLSLPSGRINPFTE